MTDVHWQTPARQPLAPPRAERHPSDVDGWTTRPDATRWRAFVVLGLGLDLLFLVVYGGANALAAGRSSHLVLHAPWERDIPLVPWMVLPYLSVGLLAMLPPFALGPRALRRLARRIALATLAAGAVFVLAPATLGFARVIPEGTFAPVFALIHQLDHPHNLVPSLHVAYTVILTGALLAATEARAGRRVLVGWSIAVYLSTVLVHQHHLLDVLGGLLLGRLLMLLPSPGGELR
ncbi:MAG: hypothetical protein H6983_13855 [Ectothiorhodospiraceae bacterium]|nr:hypothetical protein [Ectothiorhodospiraceae bacterium]